jgi:hypothetical protein
MDTCSECGVFHPLADGLGQCKKHCIERKVVPRDDHNYDIINGWPIVDGTESQCQEAE